MLLPFTQQQCFFVTILIFIVMGFQRGWRREIMSLVFVLLAVFLIRPDTSDTINAFLGRLGASTAYLAGSAPSSSSSATSFLGGPFWSLIIFTLLVMLGYYIGNRVFPKPGTAHERFIGIVPATISGAFVLFYLGSYVKMAGGQSNLQVQVEPPDPTNFVPAIFTIAIVALIIALVVARFKKKR